RQGTLPRGGTCARSKDHANSQNALSERVTQLVRCRALPQPLSQEGLGRRMPHSGVFTVSSLETASLAALLLLLTAIAVMVLKTAREQVVAMKQQWANTFDSIDDPILVHDWQGKIIRVNQAFKCRSRSRQQGVNAQYVSDLLWHKAAEWNMCPYCEGL